MLYLPLFLVTYTILKIFSTTVSPGIFLYVFLAVIFFLVLFDKKVNKISDRLLRINYKTWGKGAGAELISSKSLDELKVEGYFVIEDIQNEKGNVDLLCVGPTGIFVIEVKAHDGLISWSNGLLRNGQPLEKDFIKQVHAEVFFIKEYLQKKLNNNFYVQGILEFNNAQTDRSINGKKDGIWIGGRSFAKWVIRNKGESKLSAEEIGRIFNSIKEIPPL